jgi:hypothetical protein
VHTFVGTIIPDNISFDITTEAMVLLTVTSAAKRALEEYVKLNQDIIEHETIKKQCDRFAQAEEGGSMNHKDLIDVARFFRYREPDGNDSNRWRLDVLLKGANVYHAPPPTKPEPVGHNTTTCV